MKQNKNKETEALVEKVIEQAMKITFKNIDGFWTQNTQGLNQCVKCGVRELTPSNSNTIPIGWRKENSLDLIDFAPRADVWFGVCGDCVAREKKGLPDKKFNKYGAEETD